MDENLKEKLFNKKEVGWNKIDSNEKANINSFSNEYIKFLNNSKTEREAVCTARAIAESHGFKDVATFDTLKPGDKVYFINTNVAPNKLISLSPIIFEQ